MEISKKQQLINECREAMNKDNAGITLFVQMPTGEEEMIHNPNIAAKLAYIEKAYDEDLHLRSCPDISITDYAIHIPEEEVMDFGVALMNLKEGRRVARKGWNVKDSIWNLQLLFPIPTQPRKSSTATMRLSATRLSPLLEQAAFRWDGLLLRPICLPRIGLSCRYCPTAPDTARQGLSFPWRFNGFPERKAVK